MCYQLACVRNPPKHFNMCSLTDSLQSSMSGAFQSSLSGQVPGAQWDYGIKLASGQLGSYGLPTSKLKFLLPCKSER